MESLVERYRSFLRPGRQRSDMLLLACLITFILLLLGSMAGMHFLRMSGMPHTIGEQDSVGAVILLTLVLVGLIVYAKKRNLKPHDLWADPENA